MEKKRVLVVGLGNMGMSHALAYTRISEFEVVGVCERRIAKRELPDALKNAQRFDAFEKALTVLKPDVVSINTLPDTHAQFAMKAMEAGAHVFVEKPLADNAINAEKVVEVAKRTGKKLVIGYIMDKIHRDCAPTRHTAGVPHEPQSAVQWRDLGLAQAADGFIPSHRRLRRTLRGCHVPNDRCQADQGSCDWRQAH
jgi:threonine dehydrogenase-like Zn-dependent dehydrogenase